MITPSATRVRQHTRAHINHRIDQQTRDCVEHFRGKSAALITQRLNALDEEWDTERVLQTNFAAISVLGALLTARVNKRFGALALSVPAFMLQHALQGWCPPLAIIRRVGVRTAREINEERFLLKSLRGDFSKLGDSADAEAIVRAVQA